MAIPSDTCDTCGAALKYAPVLGAYCPNNNCGEEEAPVAINLENDTPPPENGRFVKLSSKSVQIALEEKLRAEQPLLAKVQAVELFAELLDGTQRKVHNMMLQVKHPKPDRRPGPSRLTTPSEKHPKGTTIKLVSRDGVTL